MVTRLACSLFLLVSLLVPFAQGADAPAKPKPAAAKPSDSGQPKADAAAKPAADAGDSKADQPAPPPTRWKPSLKSAPSQISVVKDRGNRLSLVIDYLWKTHDKASVEVRLIPGAKGKNVSAVPVYFVAEYLKGDVPRKVCHCLDTAADRGTSESFTKDKMVFRIVGERNVLGHPSVYVLPYNEGGQPEDRPGAVFLQLDAWSLDDHTLSLDLPRDVFEKSGTLLVWFLRGERVLWDEQLDWPGTETGTHAAK